MKNIIICSDGTGNSGGTGHSTNVFNLYKAIDIQSGDNQHIFYDDGVASTGFKYLRTASAALGFGFRNNVSKIYQYLVRHYEPGDKIFFFGFSRGAATVRAVAGMMGEIGLLRSDASPITTHGKVDSIKLKIEVIKIMHLYKHALKHRKDITKFREKHTHGVVDIEMIGVWDTVSALGFPRDSSWLVIAASKILDKLSDKLFPHNYFDYQLDSNVKNVYHALAIDDDRYTFHPTLWDEKARHRPENIEQVWFSGAHANVGGGYPRSGLAMITLDWMIHKAKRHGVEFNHDIVSDIVDGMNPAGKLYNPRDGIMIYYRFSPRHIRDLSRDRYRSILDGEIKIHRSVIDRIGLCTYAPILPNRFEIVDTNQVGSPILYNEGKDTIKKLKKRANLWLKSRSILYHVLTELTLLTGWLVWYFYSYVPAKISSSVVYNNMIDFVPAFTDNFVYYIVYENKLLGTGLVISFVLLFVTHKILRLLTTRTRKRINWWVLNNTK